MSQEGFFPNNATVRGFNPDLFTVLTGAGNYAPVSVDFASVSTPLHGPAATSTFNPCHYGYLSHSNGMATISLALTLNINAAIPAGGNANDEFRIRFTPVTNDPYQQSQGFPPANVQSPHPRFRDVLIVSQAAGGLTQFAGLPGANSRLIAVLGTDCIIRLYNESTNANPHVLTPVTQSQLSPLFSGQGGTALVLTLQGSYVTA